MNGRNQTKYILLEIPPVAFLATGGIFVRLCNVSPVNCGFYRLLFSLLFKEKIPKLYPIGAIIAVIGLFIKQENEYREIQLCSCQELEV